MKQLKIGRGQHCDIVIEDIAVSREHAELFQDDEGNVFLTDLKSSNGTFINGNQLHGSEVLNHNDIVKVGNTLLPWRNYLKGISAPTEDMEAPSEKLSVQAVFDASTIGPIVRRNLIVFSLGFAAIALVEYFGLQSDKKADGFNFFIGFMLYVFISAIITLVCAVILKFLKLTSPYIILVIAGVGLIASVYLGYRGAL